MSTNRPSSTPPGGVSLNPGFAGLGLLTGPAFLAPHGAVAALAVGGVGYRFLLLPLGFPKRLGRDTAKNLASPILRPPATPKKSASVDFDKP